MTYRTFAHLVPILALALASALPAAAQDGEITAEQLLQKNLEAKGGREKIESVVSARLTGTMNLGGTEAPFVLLWKAPDRMRIEFTLQGMTLTQAFDGETAWMINPFMGQAAPEKMSAEEAEMVKEQSDFRGPLFDPAKKGYEVAYAGEEDVEGTPTYKLELTKENGETTDFYLDQEYFLEIQSKAKREIRGQEIENTVSIGDYKEVDGLVLAHSLDSKAAGGQGPGGGFNMTVETVELNPELADERFEMPAAPAAEEGQPEEGGR